VEIHDEVTLPANEVGMMVGLDIVPGHLVQRVYLNDQTLLAEHLQSLVHGVKGNSWQPPANFVVNLLSGGMISAGLQDR
jgi:hypothetical protein